MWLTMMPGLPGTTTKRVTRLGCKNEYTVLVPAFFLGGLLDVQHSGSVGHDDH